MKRVKRLCWSEKIPERKCGQTVFVEIECERSEERGNDNGMEREWR